MDSSNYIFEQGKALFYISDFLGILLLLMVVYQCYRILKNEPYLAWRHDDGKHNKRKQVAIPALLLGIMFIAVGINENSVYKRIKKNRAETIGITLEKVHEGHFREIKYKFIVNGKAYFAECEYTYDGEQIEGIIVPNGHHKVIYNKNNPEESVMDFKANTDSLNN